MLLIDKEDRLFSILKHDHKTGRGGLELCSETLFKMENVVQVRQSDEYCASLGVKNTGLKINLFGDKHIFTFIFK